jgi:hypothetical protein
MQTVESVSQRPSRVALRHESDLKLTHVLIPILRAEISHTCRLIYPGIPHNDIIERLTLDSEPRITVLVYEHGGLRIDILVDTIRFSGYRDVVRGLSERLRVTGLVDVLEGRQIRHGGSGDIL